MELSFLSHLDVWKKHSGDDGFIQLLLCLRVKNIALTMWKSEMDE